MQFFDTNCDRSPEDWLAYAKLAEECNRSEDSWRAIVRMCATAAQQKKINETKGNVAVSVTRRKMTVKGPLLGPQEVTSLINLCRRIMTEKRRVSRYFYEIANSATDNATLCASNNLHATVDGEMQLIAADVDAIVMQCTSNASQDQLQLEVSTQLMLLSADVWRYITELAYGDKRRECAKKSLKAYKKCTLLCDYLPASNEIRLACAMNAAVLYYEILNKSEEAVLIATKAAQAYDQCELRNTATNQAKLLRDSLLANVDVWKGSTAETSLEYETLAIKEPQLSPPTAQFMLSSSSEEMIHV